MKFPRRKRRVPELPPKFMELAAYNGRRGQGVVHTPEYEARMAILQTEYTVWRDQQDYWRPE